MFKTLDKKIFATLLLAGLLGVAAGMPYMADMLAVAGAGPIATADVPLPLMVALVLVQNGLLLAVVIFLGMRLSGKVGLRMPLLQAWAEGGRTRSPVGLRAGLLAGAILGGVLVAVDALCFLQHVPAQMQQLFRVPLWKRLLAGVLYGGLTEELLMRLFVLSLLVWLVGRWWKQADGMPAPGAFWAAIGLVALLFGLAHLPATAAVVPLTPMLVLRALVLNGIGGVAFGFLYWRRGLEAAMLGHMAAHGVLQIPGFLLLNYML